MRKKLYGEFLINAQGEDVVAGLRTPYNIDRLKEISIDIYKQFVKYTELFGTMSVKVQPKQKYILIILLS